jgi:hypothetical protein
MSFKTRVRIYICPAVLSVVQSRPPKIPEFMRICNFIPTKRRNVIIKRWISIVVVPILIQLLINVGGNMGGILFMGTAMPGKIKAFYIDQV